MHLAWDHFLMEVLDETTQQPLPPGQVGMPTVTTLTREAMPLVRYVLTDRVRSRPTTTARAAGESPSCITSAAT